MSGREAELSEVVSCSEQMVFDGFFEDVQRWGGGGDTECLVWEMENGPVSKN